MKTDTPAAPILEEGTSRIEAFSDGIFGVAITLLALDLKAPVLPAVTNQNLLLAIAERWPDYLAVLNSFASVLLMWVAHHGMFRLLRKTDVPLMLTNGLLLLLIIGTPYPASVLGKYMLTPAARYAAFFYTAYFVLVSLTFAVLWEVIRYQGVRLKPGVTSALQARYKTLWVAPLLYGVIAALSLLSPFGAVFLSNVMWVYWSFATIKMHENK